jgi:2-haloacid dehalogenase
MSGTTTTGSLHFDNFKVLSFDCYGTLIDWESGILGALNKALAAHRRSIPAQELLSEYAHIEPQIQGEGYQLYREVLAEVMRRLGHRFGIVFNADEVGSLAESIRDWDPYPDTVGALRLLKTKYQLAIISNIDDDLFAYSSKKLEVPFDFVITAQQVRSYKPAAKNFEVALQRVGVAKEKVLHVAESTYHDIVPAKKLGLHTVWVNRRAVTGRGASLSTDAHPDLVVPNLKTLAGLAVSS